MRPQLLDLLSDNRGVSVIELAIVAPVLALLSVAAVDITNGFALKLHLEQAATRVVQLATVSPPTSNDLTYLEQEGVSASGQPVTNVSVKVILECNGVAQDPSIAECPEGTRQVRRMYVQIKADYQPPFARVSRIGDKIEIKGRAEMRLQ